MTLQEMLDMELEETRNISGFQILRVPNGWIYYIWNYKAQDCITTGTFVPESLGG